VLWGGMKVEKPALSNVDLEFLNNRKFNREEIFAVFKVPPSLAGIEGQGQSRGGLGSSQGGSQAQDRRVFVENTVTNLCRHLEAAFGVIVKRFDSSLEIWFDIEGLPIMQEARRDRLDSAGKAFAMGVPFNDINQVYDLGFRALDWGYKGYLPAQLEEVGEAPVGTGEPGDDPNEPENPEVAGANPIARMAALLGRIEGGGRIESECAALPGMNSRVRRALRAFFFGQRGRVLRALAKMEEGRGAMEETVGENIQQSTFNAQHPIKSAAIHGLLDSEAEDAELLAKLEPLWLEALEFGAGQESSEMELTGQFLAQRREAIRGINAATRSALESSLNEGLARGESREQLEARVREIFNLAANRRARAIAREEMMGTVRKAES